MAIQIPSAAGFIPSESVIDGISKLFDRFSPDARAKRAADLAAIQAGAGLTNAQAAEVPDKAAQGWAGVANDSARTAIEGSRVPIEQQRANTEATSQKAVDEYRKAALDEDRRRNVSNELQRAQEFSQQSNQAIQDYDLKKQNLSLEGQRTKSTMDLGSRELDIKDREIKSRDQMNTEKTLLDILTTPGIDQSAPGVRETIISNVLARHDPAAAALIRKNVEDTLARREEMMNRAGANKPKPSKKQDKTEWNDNFPTLNYD